MTTTERPLITDVAEILANVQELTGFLATRVAEDEAARKLPRSSVAAVRRSGLTILRVPVKYGGPGGSLHDLFGAIIAVSREDSNVGQALRSHFGFIEGLLTRQSEIDRQRWFDEVLAGSLFGLAEAELGIHKPTELVTSLRPSATGGYVLSGRKYYSTGSLFADRIKVLATDPEGRLLNLVIPADREGVSLIDDFDAMGQRCTASGSTVFTDVHVESEEVLEYVDWTDSDRPLTYLGGFYQLYLAAVAAGIAKNVFDDAIDYVRHRARPAVHSIAESATTDPYILEAVGEIGALAFGAEAVVLRAAESLDVAASSAAGDEAVVTAAIDVAKAQLIAHRAAIEAGQKIFDTGGASATSDSLNLSRHWRNARTIANHNPLSYKARATGDFAVNRTVPPLSGYF